MSQPKKQNRFFKALSSIGNYIYLFFQLQLFWVLFSLRGLVVLGVFPAIAGVVNTFYQFFKNEGLTFNVREEFKKAYHENFKQANIVGYICLLAIGILYVDFRVNETFIQSLVLQFLLLVLAFVVILTVQYAFTVLVRYDFSVKNIFKQSFFVALSSPTFSIASLLGLIVVIWVLESIPFLALFFGVPLLLLPVVWFTYSGLLNAENKKIEAEE